MPLTISGCLASYRSGRLTVRDHATAVMQAIRTNDVHNIWITVLSDTQLEPYLQRLEASDPSELPLYGIPFAIKDNIDLAGIPTTAACPEYAYTPDESAFVVKRLIEAGAVPVGKTNLDQFATGLVGTRSPYGACRNAFDPDYISGGSSSGSAVSVALGQVCFSLGTDTAGSGRVPAAFNNLIGVKPTCGLLSADGVVPACRTIDTISIFTTTARDAQQVLNVASAFDASDAYARADQPPSLGHGSIPPMGFCFGVPKADQLEFFGNGEAAALFFRAVDRLQQLGGTRVEVDTRPFLEAAQLLYQEPLVAERYTSVRDFIEAKPDALFPVTREIIEAGGRARATDAFNLQYQLQALKRHGEATWSDVDFVVTPTTGTIYTIDEINADPVRLNNKLGYYTNFMNLLDYSALAVPAGFQSNGLPFGVTLFAPAFYDHDLLAIGDRLHRAQSLPLGASGLAMPSEVPVVARHQHTIQVAVCGAHMRGLSLNWQLTERNARFIETTQSAPEYRFYALPGGPPERPGMLHVGPGGEAIELEVWEVPADRFGSFVADIPPPLGIGKVHLASGAKIPGFICEGSAVAAAEDITELGSWRTWLEHQDTSRSTASAESAG